MKKVKKTLETLITQPIEVEKTSMEREMDDLNEAFEEERKSTERMASRPYIDHLDDAVVDGEFIVPLGKKVVIERFVTIGEKTIWLDTRAYVVKGVNTETGDLRLYNPDLCQSAASNYKTSPSRGYRIKVAEKNTRLKGRGKSRPKKAKVERTGPKCKRGNPGKPGLRRIYDVKKLGICTRLKGVAYVAPKGTKAVAGERLMISAPNGGKVTVTREGEDWSEQWDERPGA